MLYEIFKFEIKYRIKRADTYIFFAFVFLLSLVGVDFVFQGVELGGVKKNAPLVIAKTMGAITGLLMIVTSMITGVSVIRDYQYNTEAILYTNPITKRDYLLGRFLGSLAVLLFIFSGMPFGMALGEYAPWHREEDLLPFQFISYWQSYVVVALPMICFGASLFFISGALSKKLLVVYTQGVVFFVLFMLTKAITNEDLQAILDPFSLTTLTKITAFWSVSERNTTLIPLTGVMLYNKLLWGCLGVVIFVVGYRVFNYNLVKERRSSKKKKEVDIKQVHKDFSSTIIPQVEIEQGGKSLWIQLLESTWFYSRSILKETSFWTIVICGMVIILINSISLGTVYEVDSYPATYFIVEELLEMSIYFFVIMLVFYSGELIWKERSNKINLICDATPVANIVLLAGKYLALLSLYTIIIWSLIISGIIFQVSRGYFHFQLEVYFYGFFIEVFPFLALYTCMAFFFQVLINKKFVAIVAVLLFFILNISSTYFGFTHDLYKFGGSPLPSYSDMNGYGHFLTPYLWIKAYWLVFGLLLLIITSVILVRGGESSLRKRIKVGKAQITKPLLQFFVGSTFVFICLGGYIYYNTNMLNEYWTDDEEQAFRVGYERTLKTFEYIEQPTIVDVHLEVELFPETRRYSIEGQYMLVNANDTPIKSIHVQKLIAANVAVDNIVIDGTRHVSSTYEAYGYYIYELTRPMQPNDTVCMTFTQTYLPRGFKAEEANTSVVHNGIFFRNTHIPTLGYNRKYEIQDNDIRKELGLYPIRSKAKRDHIYELKNARTGGDSKGMHLEVIVGTSADQIAIAPGDLLREWKKGNRNYYQYKTAERIINFYSLLSARYEVVRDVWMSDDTEVDLEIYYHQAHAYNLDRMMLSMKKSLDYFSTHFSPYQYNHLRIMEFPRYEKFAQSFPGTIPFSEAIGFMLDIDDTKDVDMVFYITAHEIAHQWWGMQVEAANVQGKNMILETLAQYSALMVLKEQYPKEKVQQFLSQQLEQYHKGQLKEKEKELPLSLVENQEYLYYNKGAIAMYILQEKIGEAHVNLALRNFIQDWRSHTGNIKQCSSQYATTYELLEYLREATPISLSYLVYELFETTNALTIDVN
ncbi:peptidase M1 [Aquimarina sp. TRL1]|uniref:ABC transporter permease/M1 family aminopeptidase n=1 Tax=Aquimarina sp. (strain TRL1) TaxID=2736252 RepID=UPI00158C6AE0|nr:M1 family aminopeptidase [Aquimarina sp. TRL1]QKX06121.1 peptidase M1 [Aquimarina sp. TRL1]